jgi:phosphoribosylglycinamide formyltransferase-1
MSRDIENINRQKAGVSIFASGAGTNAENCIRYFKNHPVIYINLIVTNRSLAGVINKAIEHNIPYKVYTSKEWSNVAAIINQLNFYNTSFIVLAGYLALIPAEFIKHYHNKIINLHPALLPKFGGKGMYGKAVHQAIIDRKEKETGITIHFIDETYDNGTVIFQKKIPVLLDDTPETIEKKVRELENYYLPRVIEDLIEKQFN